MFRTLAKRPPTSDMRNVPSEHQHRGGRMPLILIGLGGFAGAIARYLVDGIVADRTGGSFPWGTLVINASGSFVLGLLFALTADRAILPAEIRGPVLIGFLGAYTTFSTYA
ncbi:MAG: CrcB family protein [Candidatus Limnocylindrales bacterium]